MAASELPNELSERGIWWQVGGFTLTGCVCVAILAEFAGSEAKAYLYFEIAVTKIYWAFVIPLAGLFDGVRKLFEKRSAIRAKIRQEGVEQERRRVNETVQRFGMRDEASGAVTLPPEAMALLLGKSDDEGE